MNNQKKAQWLHKHYRPYSISWYLSNPKRLNALYQREYSNYLKNQMNLIKSKEQAKMDSQIQRLEKAYLDTYHVEYKEDFQTSKRKACEKAQAIIHLWSDVPA